MSGPVHTYIDLLVTGDDLTLDAGKNPVFVTDRDCIAQDIKHAIRESGLLVRMIGERDKGAVAWLMNEIEILVEDDLRIQPGTASVTFAETERIVITAETLAFGFIDFSVT